MTNIIYKEESYKIIGACMKVHGSLGSGFLEAVYQEALEDEFLRQGIPFERQVKLNILYNGKLLKKFYKADFVCYDKIIVEIKSAQFLHHDQSKQTLNYVKATQYKLGILVNFGQSSLVYKRLVNALD